jgi:catechol 2,3-dioxygenase-like lactoylglutathione lyase family enzyme
MAEVKVVGLDHIVLRCADVERSLEFYCDMLGLEPERVDEWRRGEVLFPSVRVDATTIIDLFAAPRSGENLDHFCLVVDTADLDELEASGAFDVHSRARGLYGAQGFADSLYVHDPDGNVVELRHY